MISYDYTIKHPIGDEKAGKKEGDCFVIDDGFHKLTVVSISNYSSSQ